MYEPIAIVGTACRFPGGASTPSRLWDLLKAPRDVLKEFTPSEGPARMSSKGFFHENSDLRGRSNVKHRSYLLEENVAHFDDGFFGINPKEAAEMDPQQRILLEVVYEAFESAGLSLHDINGSRTSVHVGVMTEDYLLVQARDPDTLGGHLVTGLSRAVLANRLSHAFNLQGPSLAIDTACSSSLVALHLAAQGLQRGEATHAVVAGTNLLVDSSWYIMESSLHMLSEDARCRMWDKNAKGYARGEGVAAVVLKTLAQAIQDNDHVECVIRATGMSSDGAGNDAGLTVPSPTAQTSMIAQTYREAGLDPAVDRCQYFEAHGTGTQAGDPAEAQAIHDAFFSGAGSTKIDQLYCGSIKTIIGHTEGCAGIAGLIKASLAVQNKSIPPNMHFTQLNPKIQPFYKHLTVPTSLLPWPEVKGPRRASINSFGFGGTNAHAIIESYEHSNSATLPPVTVGSNEEHAEPNPLAKNVTGPFVFSARNKSSALHWLYQLLDVLQNDEALDFESLSYTLQCRRSEFRFRTTIASATDREDLIEQLEDQLALIITSQDEATSANSAPRSDGAPSVFGVFTGQGAQAAKMGYALSKHCKTFRDSMASCESVLASLPSPPAWSLTQEPCLGSEESRISQSQYSQPICTAVQIALVDLLRVCGIQFRAVVGHSSGEIGAAYAAGVLSRRDAMGIAYYRGLVTRLAQGPTGKSGSMMAASMSYSAAMELCSQSTFQRRVAVAASNSPSSVTFSGDHDAILEMKELLDGQQIVARALQVDTAYHSHHMQACVEIYLKHLKELHICVQRPADGQECAWYSSVMRSTNLCNHLHSAQLEDQYWVDNLTHTVLFSKAVEAALEANGAALTFAIECGPHATLRGPVSQTSKQSLSQDYSLPYASCLSRGKNAMETFAEMLASLWKIKPSLVHFPGWRAARGLLEREPPLKGLPPYAWTHTQEHWRESRVVRSYRMNPHAPHDILGRLMRESKYEHQWRNTFRLSEMPWVAGHVFQGQVLFPATGYIALAVDAAKTFVGHQPIRFVEVTNLTIPTALPIGEGEDVEVLFTIRSAALLAEPGSVVQAEFACYSFPNGSQDADQNCTGSIAIHLGVASPTDLPPTLISDVEIIPANIDRFYKAALEIGFGYQNAFRSLRKLWKTWGHAKATASWMWDDPDMQLSCTLHPAILDNALQVGLATILSTAENSMHSPYLPVGVKRAVINLNTDLKQHCTIEAILTSPQVGLGSRIEVDINTRHSNSPADICAIQMEGVAFRAIAEARPSEDRNILAKTVLAHDALYGLIAMSPCQEKALGNPLPYSPEEYERVALFYLARLSRAVGAREFDALQPGHHQFIRSIRDVLKDIGETSHLPFIPVEWLDDQEDTILNLLQRDPGDVDMRSLASSAETNMRLLTGAANLTVTCGFQETRWSSACRQTVAQSVLGITHTHPRTNILHMCDHDATPVIEVLDNIGDAYQSYTCANPSQEVVNHARETVDKHGVTAERVSFEILDKEAWKERPPFDVVVVTELARAGQNLTESVQYIRRLLRPGGFLISVEMTGPSLRPLAIMGGFEEYWGEGGLGAALTTGQWDNLLSNSGSSGITTAAYDSPMVDMHGYSVFSSQATDDQLEILRNPLAFLPAIRQSPLVLIGGQTGQVASMIRGAMQVLRQHSSDIQVWGSLDAMDVSRLPENCSVLCLQDLDKPLWSSPPSVEQVEHLKGLLSTARNLLWVTANRLVKDPAANIMVGVGRALAHEHFNLRLQFLDFDEEEKWDLHTLLTQLLRLIHSDNESTEAMLWVREPEIVVREGRLMTPRLTSDPAQNEVHNAGRRLVVKDVEPNEHVELIDGSESSPGRKLWCSRSPDIGDDHIPMEVRLSIALHLPGEAPCYLSCGTVADANSNSAAYALTDSDSSQVSVRRDSAIRLEDELGFDLIVLAKLVTLFLASTLVSRMPSVRSSLVYGASSSLI
ncbi:hypothetical protein M409DRAFT_23584 [Zasmidium cellare ATCC 36951]|uniref:Carrier domain-containing protein n=1 Tax=Zasmidium cellare ATCC 36951 TaxID=1080233 RepID=A0A6A6CI39_ZASCE|nr:uncharacterized protein M409DRAFT_23584 [Zasmidium cellare ATCC 36951]KAF2165850.1 hypothetical protein M409DRAFT_23584 [Zasmidium cellare ATCC 36951]